MLCLPGTKPISFRETLSHRVKSSVSPMVMSTAMASDASELHGFANVLVKADVKANVHAQQKQKNNTRPMVASFFGI
jgi:hypothetical protein